jgi:hypothetical protein
MHGYTAALIAATPVGATTAICLGQFSLIYFRNVVLPVPALPVRKIFLELWFTSSAPIETFHY